MEFQYKLLTKENKATKKLDDAMWLLVGTDIKADPTVLGDKDKRIADVELRAFMCLVVYGRYDNELTTPTRHVYSYVDIGGDHQNAGAEEVTTEDGFKDWRQIGLYAGVKTLNTFEADPDFPQGPSLRRIKHARIKSMLLDLQEGALCRKIYIAHKRTYISEGKFLEQMDLVLNGKRDEAWDIRQDKIGKSRTQRKLRHTARGNGNGKTSSNWEQVVAQGGDQLPEPVNFEEADPETGEIALPELVLLDYKTGTSVNMSELPEGWYTIRVGRTPGTWHWLPGKQSSWDDFTAFAEAGYKIELES